MFEKVVDSSPDSPNVHSIKETNIKKVPAMHILKAIAVFFLALFNARAIQREDEDREEND